MSSIYPQQNRTGWIVSRRPRRAQVDPWRPYGFFLEKELSASEGVIDSAGILLTNKECPWRCLMCDLWKQTLVDRVPIGAIPAQIDYALDRLGVRPHQVKLYNSGSFFDPAAVPEADYRCIATRVDFAKHIVVEAHPRLINERAPRFRDMLNGSLEVAMGLETVNPDVLPRLNKRFTLEQFRSAAAFLKDEGIRLRAFVLVQPPFLDGVQAVEWAVKSAEFAFDCGASVVSLIPTRPGNGALDALALSGEFSAPRLQTLEQAVEQCLELRMGRVFADTWDLARFSSCPACFEAREQRLKSTNFSQRASVGICCEVCGWGLRPIESD